MDSLYEENKVFIPEIRKAYEYKIDLSRKQLDIKNELKYVNKILKLDSLNLKNFKSLSKILKEKYDNQTLLEQKAKLLLKLSKTNKSSILKSYLLYFGIVFIAGIYFYFYYKNKKFKSLFKETLDNKTLVKKQRRFSEKEINIPNEVKKKIVDGLLQFEKSNGFLKHQLTTFDLAKDLGTNKKYLTKIIKVYKQKSFPNYLNNLRIQYAINRLKNEKRFRNYTINSISEEAGFSNPLSFSQAFFKFTKMKPSQFIKELEKTKDS